MIQSHSYVTVSRVAGMTKTVRPSAQTAALIAALNAVMARRGLTPSSWAAKTGGKVHPNALYNLFNGRSKSLNIRTLQALADAEEIDVSQLTGGGSGGARGRRVPMIDLVQAGHWTEIAGAVGDDDVEYLVPDVSVGPRAFALEIRGPSMLPLFREGDRIIVDPDVTPQPGDYVVAKRKDDNEATFKQLRVRGSDKKGRPMYDLKPLNEDWPTLAIDAEHPGEIVAVVIEHRRPLRR